MWRSRLAPALNSVVRPQPEQVPSAVWPLLLEHNLYGLQPNRLLMRLALAQINPLVGDLQGNAERILAAASKAQNATVPMCC